MTVITNEDHIVVSVSLIPGLGSIPSTWHCYFPAKCKNGIPKEGDRYTEHDNWVWPLPGSYGPIPNTLDMPGAFGAVRKYDVHTGVDLYCEYAQSVHAVEFGKVVQLEVFTGPYAGSNWWNETYAVYVEGSSGVVVYGEIDPTVSIGQLVYPGDMIGSVMTVLRTDKGKPMNMLHIELHKHGTRHTNWWKYGDEQPPTLINPTEYLLNAVINEGYQNQGKIVRM